MDPIKYWTTLKRRWRLVTLCVLLGATAGWITTPEASAQKETANYFRATHTLIADSSGSTNLSQAAFLLTIGEVPERVAQALGRDAPGLLAQQVKPVANATLGTLAISAFGTDPASTERLADTFATVLLDFLREQRQADRDRQRADLSARLTDIENRLAELDSQIGGGQAGRLVVAQRDALVREYGIVYEDFQSLARQQAPTPGLVTVEAAEAIPIGGEAFVSALREATGTGTREDGEDDEEGSGAAEDAIAAEFDPRPADPPSPALRGLLGAFAGLFASVGIVLLLDRFDTRLRSKEDTETAYGLPVLAEIPPLTRKQRRQVAVISYEDGGSRITEAYRNLRTSLQFMRPFTASPGAGGNGNGRTVLNDRDERGAQVILVTSPGPTEGKTTTVANLAAVYAETGARVLVIDGDFRRPRLHEYLAGNAHRLPVAGDGLTLTLADVVAPSPVIPEVSIVTELDRVCDTGRAAELIAWIRSLVEEGRGQFDVVLLDTAPLLDVNDANELVQAADAVLLVARAGKTRRRAADRASEMLARLDAPVVGVALIGSVEVASGRRYYYTAAPRETEPPTTRGRRRRRAQAATGEEQTADAKHAAPPVGPRR